MMTESASAKVPGWPEMLVGLACLTVVGMGGAIGLVRLGIDPVALGIVLSALSGIGCLLAFFAAYMLRIRSWTAFGVKSTSWRWIGVGVLLGVGTFLVKGASILLYVWLTGDDRNPQEIYGTGASSGMMAAVAATIFMSLLTPLGEEFLFRGVIASALLRHGPLVGVAGSAIVFAVFHGFNMVFPAALVTGLAAGEIFRRSGSIWPAVAVHVVVNAPTIPVMLLAGISIASS
jgi:membrane protease YdiL (CAAX protease family)